MRADEVDLDALTAHEIEGCYEIRGAARQGNIVDVRVDADVGEPVLHGTEDGVHDEAEVETTQARTLTGPGLAHERCVMFLVREVQELTRDAVFEGENRPEALKLADTVESLADGFARWRIERIRLVDREHATTLLDISAHVVGHSLTAAT